MGIAGATWSAGQEHGAPPVPFNHCFRVLDSDTYRAIEESEGDRPLELTEGFALRVSKALPALKALPPVGSIDPGTREKRFPAPQVRVRGPESPRFGSHTSPLPVKLGGGSRLRDGPPARDEARAENTTRNRGRKPRCQPA
jgi:hypothetical protein